MNVVGKKGFLRLCILAVLPVLVSCVRTGIVSGVPVTYARPDRVVQASADTSFRRAFPEVLYIRDGDFLYDIRVTEDIGNITYDGRTGYLYCIDMDGNIVRYDLSELMPATTV